MNELKQMKITIENYQISAQQTIWFLEQTFKKSIILVDNRKKWNHSWILHIRISLSDHHHWIRHIQISLGTK